MANTSGSSLKTKTFPYRSIAIFGAGGQLGRALAKSFGESAVSFDRLSCNFLNPQAIRSALASEHFSWAINAAAYTNVDGAESDATNCYAVNHRAVELLADTCQQSNVKLLQISTDYVFGGSPEHRKPWTESDPTHPEGVYAKSKLLGEQATMKCDEHLILRTCGLYDVPSLDGKVRNFCNTILSAAEKRRELSIVNDQWCTPTYVPHLIDAVKSLMQCEARGLVHVVNEGATNWFEFGCRLLQLDGKTTHVNPISSAEYCSTVKRPEYSVLDTKHYQSLVGDALPNWEDALKTYIRQRRDITVLNN